MHIRILLYITHTLCSSGQFSRSVVFDSLQPHEPQHAKSSLSITNSWSPPKPMSIELVMLSNHLILLNTTQISLAIVQRSLNIYSFFSLFFFSAFRLNNFYYSISKFTGSFFHPLHSAIESKAHTLYFRHYYIFQF